MHTTSDDSSKEPHRRVLEASGSQLIKGNAVKDILCFALAVRPSIRVYCSETEILGQEAFPLLRTDNFLGDLVQPLVWSTGKATELSAQGTAEPGVDESERLSVTPSDINLGIYIDGRYSKTDDTRRPSSL